MKMLLRFIVLLFLSTVHSHVSEQSDSTLPATSYISLHKSHSSQNHIHMWHEYHVQLTYTILSQIKSKSVAHWYQVIAYKTLRSKLDLKKPRKMIATYSALYSIGGFFLHDDDSASDYEVQLNARDGFGFNLTFHNFKLPTLEGKTNRQISFLIMIFIGFISNDDFAVTNKIVFILL